MTLTMMIVRLYSTMRAHGLVVVIMRRMHLAAVQHAHGIVMFVAIVHVHLIGRVRQVSRCLVVVHVRAFVMMMVMVQVLVVDARVRVHGQWVAP